MEVAIYIKGNKEPIIYKGERIDILDFTLDNIEYKQIRYFKKGISKSELIKKDLIIKVKEIKKMH